MRGIAAEADNAVRQLAAVLICILTVMFPAGAAAQSGLSNPVPVGPFLDGSLPSEPPGFDPNASLSPENYFPALTFVEPIRIVEHPNEDKLVIVSKDGTFWLVDNQPGATNKTLFLDLSDQIQGISGAGEGGVGGFVFHPEFGDPNSPNSGYVYVWYRWSPNPGFFSDPTIDGYERLSRFTVPDGETVADPSSELVMIQQFDRSQNHIGGDMFFGPDGFLYLSVGDEGNCCDRIESTQRLDGGLFSGLLRIDVDKDSSRSHPIVRQPENVGTPPSGWPDSFTQGYYIPDDNPFADSTGGQLEEFYALGLRHPWTVDRDPDTGRIWTADVGQDQFEEVDIVESGHNYQWAYKEGKNGTGLIAKPSTVIGTETPPIWDYDHNVGQAIIGAGVYRGTKHPDLFGKYLVSDFLSGFLWSLDGTSESDLVVEQIGTVPAGFPSGINSYLLDRHGRILMAKTAGALDPNGTIQELVSDGTSNPEPPAWLSQTAAFDNVATLDVHDGCIPYDLIEPFWSDAALKSRWLCVPNDGTHDLASEQIKFSENGEWQFPVGTVLIKHFEILLDESDPSSAKRLETRFIVHSNNGYYGVTYKWLDDGSDAELLTTSVDETLNIVDEDGVQREQVWHYPSRAECLRCHNDNAGSVLGPKTRQLNKEITYPSTGVTANQLSTMDHLGMFDQSISDSQIDNFLTMVNSLDEMGSLEDRGRTYLDSNCSYCHRSGGVRANFDARYTVPLSQQELLYGELVESTGVEGDAVIVPGNLELSRAYQRAATAGSDAMPPLAKNKVDEAGIAVLADWIDQAGLVGNSSDTDGSFIDSHHPSLFFNEADVLTNNSSQTAPVMISEFRFYARQLGNPVTPIVAKVKGDNSFEVVAIGTTRLSSEYQVGENRFPFDDNSTDGIREISLAPGETLITGFSDSVQPGGTEWGAGPVIPADTGTGEDEIWALLPDPLILASDGFVSGVDTPSVQEGEDPLDTNAGKSLKEYTSLERSYRFGIVMVLDAEGGASTTTNLLDNGSFEDPTVTDNDGRYQIFEGSEIPGWTIPVGDVDIVSQLVWSAADGAQSLDLNGTTAGAVEQTVSDLVPSGQYELSLKYAAQLHADGERSADVRVDGVLVGSLATSTKVPAYQEATYQFQADDTGAAVITIESTSFSDSTGLVIDDVRLISLEDSGNSNPVIDAVADQTDTENSTVSLFVNASDPDGDSLTYTATGLPPDLTINSSTGEISGTLASGSQGTYTVTVTVDDGNGGSASTSFSWTVNPPSTNSSPSISSIADQVDTEGYTVSLQVSASDPDGDTLTYSATGLPADLAIDSSTGLISGTLATGSQGTYSVIVTVDDGNGGSAGTSFGWTVNPPSTNGSPSISSIAAQENTEGETVSLQVSASDPDGDTLTYSATGLPADLAIDSSTGLISGTLATGSQGTYNVIVTVDDGNGGTASTSFDWTVTTASGGGGSLVNGSFEDPIVTDNGGRYQYYTGSEVTGWLITGDIDLVRDAFEAADGAQSMDLNGTDAGSVSQTVTGLTAGTTYQLSVQWARHPYDGASGTRSADVMVNGAVVGTLSTSTKVPSYNTSAFDFTPASDGSAEITFMSTSTGTSVGIIIDDVQLSSGTANNSPSVTSIGTQESYEGDTVSLQVSASDPDGDTLTYSATGLPADLAIDSSTGLISGTLATGSEGTYTIVVTVDDGNGGTDSTSFDWVVNPPSTNSSPSISSIDAQTNTEGETVSLQVSASDPDGDTLSYSADGLPADLAIDSSTGLISGTVAIGSQGTYSVTAAVDDGNGGTASATFDWTVTAGDGGSVVNGSFEEPIVTENDGKYQLYTGSEVTGWLITGDIDIVRDAFEAADGSQSMDLNGTDAGSVSQTVTGLTAGTTYQLSVQWARHPYDGASGTRSADVMVNGAVVGTLSTSTKVPSYTTSAFDFTPASDGSAEIAFVSTSTGTSVGIIIDDVQVNLPPSGPKILNGDFELDGDLGITTVLTDWTVPGGNVEIKPEGYSGTYALDLNGSEPGTIEQVISDLTPGNTYTVYLAWADQSDRSGSGGDGTLATGEVYVDGEKVGTMRTTADAPFFVDCNGFSFVPTNSQATLQIKSTTSGEHGLLIDAVQLESGGLPEPPSSTQIVNGGFETPLDPPDRDPHVCGFDLPGWLVTQENVDVITNSDWGPPEGESVLDLGGHGPGGIAQTVTGLTPGTTYRLSFQYARHQFWTQVDPLTADVLVDGTVVLSLSRDETQMAPDWESTFVDFVAPADGEVTIEFQSTSLTVGGSVVIDDVAIQETP